MPVFKVRQKNIEFWLKILVAYLVYSHFSSNFLCMIATLAANENSKTNTGGWLGPYHYEKSCNNFSSPNIQHLAQVTVFLRNYFIKPKVLNPDGISNSNSWMKFISVEECQTQIRLENLDSITVKENACFWFFIHNDWLKLWPFT